MGNLSTPKSVQKLQMALQAKAKAEAGYRFYALYDKISREDILTHAFAQCRSNKGAPGTDGQDFADIETYGVERWLGELALALRQETYRPDPIRRVYIPKANGKLRPLGIPTLRDRVCMTAATLVLEPIFEADLPSEQYAYRPGRNAQQAVVEVEALMFRGHPEVVDADLTDYFGSIPHAELLKSVARRIVDRRVLHLIKMWPECPVEETDDRGRKKCTTEARDNRRGIPQGAPISPLLANLYMRRFVLGWKMLGLERSLGTRIVTYADDLVILRTGNATPFQRRIPSASPAAIGHQNLRESTGCGEYPRARDRAVVAVDPIAEAGGEKPKKNNGSAARHHVGPERDAAAAPRACARNRGRGAEVNIRENRIFAKRCSRHPAPRRALTTAPDNTNNVLALAFGVLIVALVIGGSVWIMGHLDERMMPSMNHIMQMQR